MVGTQATMKITHISVLQSCQTRGERELRVAYEAQMSKFAS
jgi:hypothetical protein